MKVAMIGQKGMPALYGGVERHVEALSSELAQLGLDITVYARTHYTAYSHIENGVNIKVLPSINTKHWDAITHTFVATIRAILDKADIFHFHGVGPALLCFLPRILRPSSKVIVTFHCIDRLHQKWGLIARFFLRLGEWCACALPHQTVVVSRELQKYCLEKYGAKTFYIPHGIKSPELDKPYTKTLKEMSLKPGYILTVSRLVRHKGIHYLIEAYNEISRARTRARKNKIKNPLVIVGDSANTDAYARELKLMAGKNKKIIFTGFRSGESLKALYCGAKLVVQPSESEGLSLVILEAMSLGKAVLVSDIPANLEAIGPYGFTFKSKDAVDLRSKLEYLLKDRILLRRMGEEAENFALKKYSWESSAKQTIEVYNDNIKFSTGIFMEYRI